MHRCSVVLFVVAVAAGLAGCQSSPPGSYTVSGSVLLLDADSARGAALSSQQVAEAHKLYTAKCVRCHKSYDPASYTEAEWRNWMSRMSRKARLDPAQEELLSRYLEACRVAPPTSEKPSTR